MAVQIPCPAEVYDFPLGKDDLTGEEVTVKLGRSHPFVTWTRAEAEGFKERLESTDPKHRGTRYGWNHRINGPPVKAAKGDPIACAKVWWVTDDRAAARKTAEFLLDKARSFKTEDFVKLGCWNAPRELEKSAICFDLIAGSDVLSPAELPVVRAYLQSALASLRKLDAYYGKYHNIGTAIDQAAWTAALCLEDREMLKELFARFKEVMGRGLLPGGYWYEGTAYGSMVRGNTNVICERTARAGLDMALLNCRRKPMSPKWTVKEGFVRAGEMFEWPYRVVAPFRETPNIADGMGPRRFSGHGALTFGRYVPDAELVNRYYIRDLTVNKIISPHIWGDFPPDPEVEPLEQLGDVAWPEPGLFIFRQGTGLDPNDQYVLFHALPRTGYHPHSDQGHLSIARYGRWLTGDPESSARSTGYQKLRDAFSATRWAHNTVVVGGQWGKSEIDFPNVHYASATDPNAGVKVADLTISDFTKGPVATQRRRVLVANHFIVVTDDLTSTEETTFDWFFHGAANAAWTLDDPPGLKTDAFLDYIPTTSEPDHALQWHDPYRTEAAWRGSFLVDEEKAIGLRVWQLDAAGGSYCAGDMKAPKHGDPGIYADQSLHLICQRKTGKKAQFTAVLEPYQGKPGLKSVKLERNLPNDRILIVEMSDGRSVRVSIGDGAYAVEEQE